MKTQAKEDRMFMMVRVFSAILLFVIGVSALFGGASLIIDPSGASLGMNTEILRGTPFINFLFPGIILFLLIGVLSTSAAILVLIKHKTSSLLVLYQGVVLTIWIMVQIYLLPQMHMLQIVFGLFGLILILAGNYLRLKSNSGYMKVIY